MNFLRIACLAGLVSAATAGGAHAQIFVGPSVVSPRYVVPPVIGPRAVVVAPNYVPWRSSVVVAPRTTLRPVYPVTPAVAPPGLRGRPLSPVVIGPGIGGFPNRYVRGQPVRNALRFAIP